MMISSSEHHHVNRPVSFSQAKNPQQALKMALKVLHDMHIDHVTVQVQDDADIDELCISAPYVRNGSCHA